MDRESGATPDPRFFRSRGDARTYLACQLLQTVGVGVAIGLFPLIEEPWWALALVPVAVASIATDIRLHRWAEAREGRAVNPLNPFSRPIMRARQAFGTLEPLEEAFRWLGIDPEKAPTARYVALWITGILFAIGFVPALLQQMA